MVFAASRVWSNVHPEGDRGAQEDGSSSSARAGPSGLASEPSRGAEADSSQAGESGTAERANRKGRKRRRAHGKARLGERGKRADQGAPRPPETPQQSDPQAKTETGAAARRGRGGRSRIREGEGPLYAALDLGTNNCRLLIARRTRDGFRVVDAFSRIVRLGEGLTLSGRLGEEAMDRAVEALRICADKMARRGVARSRLIATQACRIAENGAGFIARVKQETGLALEIVTTEEEARLAVAGCAPLLDHACHSALVFDIGGGSTDLIWVRLEV